MTEKKTPKKTIWEKISNEAGSKKTPEPIEEESTEQASTNNETLTNKHKATQEAEPMELSSSEDLLTHSTYKALQAELNEKDSLLNKLTYRLAEGENEKRRWQQEIENTRKFASEKIIKDLLPCIDNLERAIDLFSQGADRDPILKGVELTLQMFRKVLDNQGVKTIAPAAGEAFDSHYHQAMSMQESNEQKPDTILLILQKGYSLQGRLIRPAAVIVAKAPEETS